MTLIEFVSACHKAQHDAGNFEYFSKLVGHSMEICGDNNMADPVAAFIGALIANCNGDINEARRSIDFWTGELTRVSEAVFLDD